MIQTIVDPLKLSGAGTNPVSYKQFVDRLAYARPVDLTRQQEKEAEPSDEVSLQSLTQPEAPVVEQPRSESEPPPFTAEAPPQDDGLSQMRDQFQSFLDRSGGGSSLLDSNFEGMLSPYSGAGEGAAPEPQQLSLPFQGGAAEPPPLPQSQAPAGEPPQARGFAQPPPLWQPGAGPQAGPAGPAPQAPWSQPGAGALPWQPQSFVPPQEAPRSGWGSKLLMAGLAMAPMLMSIPLMMNPMMGFMNPMMMMAPMMSTMMLSMMMPMPPPMAFGFPNMFGGPTPGMDPMAMGMPGMPMPGMPGMPGMDPWSMGGPQAPSSPQPGTPNPGMVVSPTRPRSGEPAAAKLVNGGRVTLSEAQLTKLSSLPEAQQKKFDELWRTYDGAALELPGHKQAFSVNESLARLLDEAKLESRDRDGHTLVDNIHMLSTDQLAAGLDPKAIAAQALVHVADPGRTITQGDHGTCAATTVEYMLASRKPAEFVRVARGITGQEGFVQLAGGKVATRVEDSVDEDRSGRGTLDRMMQAAMMNAAGEDDGNGRYSNRADGFVGGAQGSYNPHGLDPNSFLGRALGGFGTDSGAVQSGLQMHQTERLAENAMGEGYKDIFDWQSTPEQAMGRLTDLTKDGKEQIPVSLRWDGGRHRILVTKVENGRVFFRNPWGHRDENRRNERLRGVDHQVGDDGVESIPVGAFQDRMASVLVPEHLL